MELESKRLDLQELVKEGEDEGEDDGHDVVTEGHDGDGGVVLVGDDGGNLGDGGVFLLLEVDGGAFDIELLIDELLLGKVFGLLLGHY
jgi:hypothetical protein